MIKRESAAMIAMANDKAPPIHPNASQLAAMMRLKKIRCALVKFRYASELAFKYSIWDKKKILKNVRITAMAPRNILSLIRFIWQKTDYTDF